MSDVLFARDVSKIDRDQGRAFLSLHCAAQDCMPPGVACEGDAVWILDGGGEGDDRVAKVPGFEDDCGVIRQVSVLGD